jgi:hypothetical protein
MTQVGPQTDAVLYVATVLSLYLELPDTPLRISLPDQAVARRWQASGIPCEVVETALLLGSLRRFDRPPDASALPRIRSLGYFQPVIEELLASPLSAHYRDFLRLKMQRLCAELHARPSNVT